MENILKVKRINVSSILSRTRTIANGFRYFQLAKIIALKNSLININQGSNVFPI